MNKINFYSTYFTGLFLASLSIILIIMKFESLSLPHYWDEAFPYSYAIGYMTENGAGIRSASAPQLLTTGHPLLYYFLQANWNSFIGENLTFQRLFPLFISIFCLIMTFFVGKQLFNQQVGLGASALLLCQNTFIVQSSFQLPETLLTLLLLCSIYFLLINQKILFMVFSGLMIFTKEPAIILFTAIFIYDFFFFKKSEDFKKRLLNSWIYTIPVFINLFFYIDQYYTQGWFLFPRHIGFMSSDISVVIGNLDGYFNHLFLKYGRNILFLGSILIFSISYWKNKDKTLFKSKFHNLSLPVIIIVSFLLFCAFNFHSDRYILCLFPLFCIIISSISFNTKSFFPFLIILFASVTLTMTFKVKNDSDTSLGYKDTITTQKQAIDYCISKKWKNKPIHTSFLITKYTTSYHPKYVNKNHLFTSINNWTTKDAEILIIPSNEKEQHYLRENSIFELHKRFESGNAWCEIYTKK